MYHCCVDACGLYEKPVAVHKFSLYIKLFCKLELKILELLAGEHFQSPKWQGGD